MKLPLITSIKIFWQESFSYIISYGIYALIVCSIVLYIENRLLLSELTPNTLLSINSGICLLAISLYIVNSFISGWLTEFFGGEILTFFITLIVSWILIYTLNMYLFKLHDLQFLSPKKISFYISLVLCMPYILFNMLVFALGSGFKN